MYSEENFIYLSVLLSTTPLQKTHVNLNFQDKVLKIEHIIKDTNAPTTNVGLKTWFWKVNSVSPMYEKMKFSAKKLRSSNN